MTYFNKVKTMLEKVQVNLPQAEVAKPHVQQNFQANIHTAVEYLGTEFADMFADAITFKRGRARAVRAAERATQRSRTDDNEPCSRDGITTFFGVDVTDMSCTYSS